MANCCNSYVNYQSWPCLVKLQWSQIVLLVFLCLYMYKKLKALFKKRKAILCKNNRLSAIDASYLFNAPRKSTKIKYTLRALIRSLRYVQSNTHLVHQVHWRYYVCGLLGWFILETVSARGGVLPSKRLLGMCRWMGSHFHNWTDYNGVTFLVELLEWGRTFSGFLG